MHHVHENVKRLRKKNNITVRQLAKAIDVAPTTLSPANLNHAGIRLSNIIKIAVFFNVSIDYLVFGSIEKERYKDANT